VARTVTSEGSLPHDYNFNHVAAGVAVLAAIAASDSLCCTLLGERPRGQDHGEAVELLRTVRFGDGSPAAQTRRAHDLGASLATALDLKDRAHYGVSLLGAQEVRRLIKAAAKLVDASGAALGLSG
jgi:hypothetical protein